MRKILLLIAILIACIDLSAQITNTQLEYGTKERQTLMTYTHPSGLYIRHFVDVDTMIAQRVEDSLSVLRAYIDALPGGGSSGADWNTNLTNIPTGFADGIDNDTQGDWNESDTSDPAYIANKPTPPDLSIYQTIAGTANFDRDSTDNLTKFSTVNNSTGVQLSLLSDDASESTTLFLDGGDEFDITRENQAGLDGGRIKFRADTVGVLATKHDLTNISGGTTIWKENANGIDNDSQNVGINDDTPTAPLVVKDSIGAPAGSVIGYIGDQNNQDGVIFKKPTSSNPEVAQIFGPIKLLDGTQGDAGLLSADGDRGVYGQTWSVDKDGVQGWNYPYVPDTADVYIISGQSNAYGIAPNADASYKIEDRSFDRMQLWNKIGSTTSGTWSDISMDDSNSPANTHGPELYFSYLSSNNNHIDSSYLVKYAFSAQNLCSDFNPDGTGVRYNELKNSILGAKMNLESEGIVYRFRSMLWVQGEADAQDLTCANDYADNMREFADSIRSITNQPDLRIVCVRLSSDLPLGNYPHRDIVIEQQIEFDTTDKYTVLLDGNRYDKIADNIHYNAEGQAQLGREYYTVRKKNSDDIPLNEILFEDTNTNTNTWAIVGTGAGESIYNIGDRNILVGTQTPSVYQFDLKSNTGVPFRMSRDDGEGALMQFNDNENGQTWNIGINQTNDTQFKIEAGLNSALTLDYSGNFGLMTPPLATRRLQIDGNAGINTGSKFWFGTSDASAMYFESVSATEIGIGRATQEIAQFKRYTLGGTLRLQQHGTGNTADGLPVVCNIDNTDTGIYFEQDDEVGFTVDGVGRIIANSTGVQLDGLMEYIGSFALDGTGVPNGSLYKGTDDLPYWKDGTGTVLSLTESTDNLANADQDITAFRTVDVQAAGSINITHDGNLGLSMQVSGSSNPYMRLGASATGNGLRAYEDGKIELELNGLDAQGSVPYVINNTDEIEYGSADNIGRLTTTQSLWGNARQTLVATSANYPTAITIAFPVVASWTSADARDGDILTFINKSTVTLTLNGDFDSTTASDFDIASGETGRFVWYEGGGYWISIR